MSHPIVVRPLVHLGVASALIAGAVAAAPAVAGSQASTRPAHVAHRPAGDVGHWSVRPAGVDRYVLTWTSPRAIVLGGARPQMWDGHRELATPSVSADRRRVRLTVRTAVPPDPADLDVVLSGRTLDEPARQAKSPAADPYSPLPGTMRLTPDPGVPGTHAVVSSDYELEPATIPGLAIPVEMVGHVVAPRDADEHSPLVLFLHGKHEVCYETPDGTGSGDAVWPCREGTSPIPSQLGYDYAQRLLASQGYVTVSIAANGVNAQDDSPDGGAQARALLVRQHLAHWARWVRAGTYSADLDHVVLIGHSRGGEGVMRAGQIIPLSAPYRVVGLVTIGSTNFTRQVAGYIPTVSLLPYCDGDVIASDGQSFTDLGRDLAAGDTALRSSVMVMGANHNFFNTEWTPATSVAPEAAGDDWGYDPDATCGRDTPERLTAAQQRRVGKAYLAGAVRLLARDDARMLPLFDGSRVSLKSAGDADVRSHAVGGGRDTRVPGRRVRLSRADGATTSICAGYAKPGLILGKGSPRPSCGRGISSLRTPHWPSDYLAGVPTIPGFEMTWTASGQSGGLRFARPLDLSGAESMDLRTIVDVPRGDVRLAVTVHDGSGSATVTPVGGAMLPALPSGPTSLGKRWAQTVRVSTADLAGLDLADITGVDLVGLSPDGRIWVLDAAAVPGGLAPVPAQRLPRVSIGDVRVVEGDGPQPRTIPVPYTVRGDVSRPSRVVVIARNLMDSSRLGPYRTTIPAGQRHGSFELPYRPDDRDDVAVQQYETQVYGVHGAVGQDSKSEIRLVDDDPRPDLTIEQVAPVIGEGDRAVWQATLSKPVDYEVALVGTIVAGDGVAVSVADTTASWRRHHLDPSTPGTTPLHEADVFLSGWIPRGETSGQIVVPIRTDGVAEGRETITARLHGFRFGAGHVLTVVVRDASGRRPRSDPPHEVGG